MSIDRIGKSGGVPTTPEVGEKAPVEKTFSVDRSAPVGGVEQVDKASPLERLKAGEIDVNQYVDLKVDRATQGLQGLSPDDLADVKQVLREQMVSDPEFVDLVKQATGKVPQAPRGDDE